MGRDGFLWVTTSSAIYRLVAAPLMVAGVPLIALGGGVPPVLVLSVQKPSPQLPADLR